jgi:hypothetical protein
MFDIASFDILTPSEEGRDVTLLHPKTGQPWMDDAKRPITITVLGRWSGIVQQTSEAIEARRAARPSGVPETLDDRILADAEYMAAATRRWSFTHLGGEAFPFTPANAVKLYSDPRFPWLRIQVMNFHRQDGNFLAEPTSPPSTGPKEPSA